MCISHPIKHPRVWISVMDAAASEDGDDHLFISSPRSVRDLTAKSVKTPRGRTASVCHGAFGVFCA